MRRWTWVMMFVTCTVSAIALLGGLLHSTRLEDSIHIYWFGLGLGIVIGGLSAVTLQRMAVEHWGDRGKAPPAEDEDAKGWGEQRPTVETTVTAVFGVIVAAMVAQVDMATPAIAFGIGAAVTAGALVLVDGRTYYAGGGAIFALLSAGVIQLGAFPASYQESPFAVLLTLGGVSALIVSVHLGIGLVLQRALAGVTGETTALRIYDAIAAILGLIGMIWAVINFHERAARYGGITIGGTAGFVLNVLGVELPIPWIIGSGVDAALVLYIGAILIAFHTLESLHTTWRATKATASASADVGRAVGEKARDAVEEN